MQTTAITQVELLGQIAREAEFLNWPTSELNKLARVPRTSAETLEAVGHAETLARSAKRLAKLAAQVAQMARADDRAQWEAEQAREAA